MRFAKSKIALAGLAVLGPSRKNTGRPVADAESARYRHETGYTGGLRQLSGCDHRATDAALQRKSRGASSMASGLVTSVQFVKALGGGWDASSIAALKVKPSNQAGRRTLGPLLPRLRLLCRSQPKKSVPQPLPLMTETKCNAKVLQDRRPEIRPFIEVHQIRAKILSQKLQKARLTVVTIWLL